LRCQIHDQPLKLFKVIERYKNGSPKTSMWKCTIEGCTYSQRATHVKGKK
jgi:hypothetical protein